MDSRDQSAIDQLFDKIENVQRQAGPRDAEAEAYLRARLGQNPAAAYYMAQTIIVQEQALNAAQERMDEMESQTAGRSGGGLLGSLFGGGAGRSAGHVRSRSGARQSHEPWGASRGIGGMSGGMGRPGGSFLGGAAQTAMGVAGGVVLGSMLADFLSPDEAAAAGIGGEDAGAETDLAANDLGDTGGDFGGDFDMGDF